MQAVEWTVDVSFQEDPDRTDAIVTLTLADGTALRAQGHARRNPDDPARPRVGEEIAAARAMSDLVHQLMERAATEIEDVTHQPAHLSV
ncbi:uncharacterized protein DUF1876 [Haloactinopolyspora alba]|uniref:Uncharacterized protein DUF1876 n=1 Tax=Haloactinopolyspora alba TaxID=648780 RepID=A0A2P8DWC1_9ACTN|nr:DUF1876 domain-containing protein [Haloactinopolyspora alba]PSL01530.1 uncharacterized protein DUF1876 [Haloactinopolyspora alba]